MAMSLTPQAPSPPREMHLWHMFFALLAMNGPLIAAELKFRENTGYL